jgi:uncharacterized protein YecT (DUF1311 family)
MSVHRLNPSIQRNGNLVRWVATASVALGLCGCQRAPARDAPAAAVSGQAAVAGADGESARRLPCWEKAQTQADLNGCAVAEAKQAQTEMARALDALLKARAADAVAVQKLNAAQTAWLAYRDAELAARFPSAEPATDYGSAFPTCFGLEQARLFQDRTRALGQLAARGSEPDACSSNPDGGS